MATLKSIHKAGVLHGDIRLPNLCLSDEGEATIIDFSHAKRYPTQEEKDNEIAELRALLGMEEEAPAKRKSHAGTVKGVRQSQRIQALQLKEDVEETPPVQPPKRRIGSRKKVEKVVDQQGAQTQIGKSKSVGRKAAKRKPTVETEEGERPAAVKSVATSRAPVLRDGKVTGAVASGVPLRRSSRIPVGDRVGRK